MAELEIVDEHVHEHERKRKAAHKKDHNEHFFHLEKAGTSRHFHLIWRRRAMVSSIFSESRASLLGREVATRTWMGWRVLVY